METMVRISVRVPPAMERDLQTLAGDGRPADVIREALRVYLKAKQSVIRRRLAKIEKGGEG